MNVVKSGALSILDKSAYPDVHSLKSLISKGLWALWIARDELGVEDPMTVEEIVSVLVEADVAIDGYKLAKAFATVGTKAHSEVRAGKLAYRISEEGRRYVRSCSSASEGVEVVHLVAGRALTNRLRVNELLKRLRGPFSIVDPWYGVGSFAILEQLATVSEVRFLTAKTNEPKTVLSTLVKSFRAQFSKSDLRSIAPPMDVHDRYIIADQNLVLLGQGIKDIGIKQSFVILLPNSIARDLIDSVSSDFEARWKTANPL